MNITNPFIFGKVVEGDNFTNRKDEIERLTNNIKNQINITLISPRRWGKSSLVKVVANKFSIDHQRKFCFINLFNIRNEKEFYRIFSNGLLKITSNKIEEFSKNVMEFLSKFKPKISLGPQPQTEVELSLNFDEENIDYSDILNLPEKLATKKKIKIVICIDEFQNLSTFDEPLLFQQRLRSSWQYHKNTTYCIYGSKRHLMMHIFNNQSMPFYKFGDVIFLEKISTDDLGNFILNKFDSTGKMISIEIANKIIDQMENHPYYIQQFSHIIWNETDKKVTDLIFKKSLRDLIFQNTFLFEKIFETLSNKQVSFLKVLVDGISEGFFSASVIKKYDLGSSAGVNRIIKLLEDKEIIIVYGRKVEFLDPVFKLWLKDIFSH